MSPDYHGLNVLCRRVDVAVQAELEHDLSGAQGVGGAHGIHPGDGGELALQRRGDRRGHSLRTCSRQTGAHLQGGIVHVREIAHRQTSVSHESEQKDAQHDERRHYRPADEQFSDVHEDFSGFPWGAFFTHELPRPKAVVGVLEARLQLDGSRRAVHGVVDKRQCALGRRKFIVGNQGFHSERSARLKLLDLGEVLFRHGKRNIDGTDLVNHHQHGLV